MWFLAIIWFQCTFLFQIYFTALFCTRPFPLAKFDIEICRENFKHFPGWARLAGAKIYTLVKTFWGQTCGSNLSRLHIWTLIIMQSNSLGVWHRLSQLGRLSRKLFWSRIFSRNAYAKIFATLGGPTQPIVEVVCVKLMKVRI